MDSETFAEITLMRLHFGKQISIPHTLSKKKNDTLECRFYRSVTA